MKTPQELSSMQYFFNFYEQEKNENTLNDPYLFDILLLLHQSIGTAVYNRRWGGNLSQLNQKVPSPQNQLLMIPFITGLMKLNQANNFSPLIIVQPESVRFNEAGRLVFSYAIIRQFGNSDIQLNPESIEPLAPIEGEVIL